MTDIQTLVLDELRKIGRESLFRYRESSPYLFQNDCEKIRAGDEKCVFGMGGLSWWIGGRLDISTAKALRVLKALEKKGLVIREVKHQTYSGARYWWPIGLAAELAQEIPK